MANGDPQGTVLEPRRGGDESSFRQGGEAAARTLPARGADRRSRAPEAGLTALRLLRTPALWCLRGTRFSVPMRHLLFGACTAPCSLCPSRCCGTLWDLESIEASAGCRPDPLVCVLARGATRPRICCPLGLHRFTGLGRSQEQSKIKGDFPRSRPKLAYGRSPINQKATVQNQRVATSQHLDTTQRRLPTHTHIHQLKPLAAHSPVSTTLCHSTPLQRWPFPRTST